MKRTLCLLAGIFLLSSSGIALGDDDRGAKGLDRKAKRELIEAGVGKYLGEFTPAASIPYPDGWTKHTFDPAGGDGPICIVGTPYSVFTKIKDPKKLLIFLQGGGACWQNFYACTPAVEEIFPGQGNQEPPPDPAFGIWAESGSPGAFGQPNPLDDYSIVYLPYCDGSVFTGDNAVWDASFPFGPVRYHRGLRNASAGVDVAKAMFPKARKIVVSGSSAGGVGASAFTPFLVRMAFGNRRQLSVLNDAGPVAVDLNDVYGAIPVRAWDWNFDQFFPASCTDCSALGQQTAIIKWRLDNDSSIRESFYSTDGDETNRFFLGVFTQQAYRNLIVTEHGKLNAAHPDRYKRFIRSGDDSHTALQTPLFHLGTANGVPLFEWVADFLKPGKRAYRERDDDDGDSDSDSDRKKGPKKSAWVDIVEDFVPVPPE